ncbi:DUF6298 domain-containing protein [Rufibacter glacialis]|uniref:DUF6298 domain-containing protein n=1 Tax=Rufibacter glacialis TaxID=1259555 RepID=A0A5M8Q8Q7_9BACT|nr:DUF6298 domain-containing protein [Rufibacter glacialis]KAA6432317.1 hypothetical protein FOE74_14500 [Rufibacter glacialis]
MELPLLPVHAQPTPFLPAIDFSHAGYGGGGVSIPKVPAVLLVRPSGQDDTKLLQGALDQAARLPLQPNGFRGALQLGEGKFLVSGQLHLKADGVVLRGSGNLKTIIVATGKGRRSLLVVGKENLPKPGPSVKVTDQVVPAGSRTFTLETLEGFHTGDLVVITRPSTKEWIAALGMDTLKGVFSDLRFHWPAGSRNLVWDRTIISLDPAKNQITVDAPITTALEKPYGGGTVAKVMAEAPLQHLGLENLVLESEFSKANPKDEEHAWYAISVNHVQDAWVQNITARHFVSSAVRVGPRARRITVESCRSEQPISEVGGYRRHSFLVEGQQVLVQHCTAEAGINDFAIGFTAAGPNVFLNCIATKAQGPSGSFESWASGVLYENVQVNGNGLRLTYDIERAQAGGWTAANSVLWNCTAQEIVTKGPATAPVVSVTSPEPLFSIQLSKRLGKQALAAIRKQPAEYTQTDFSLLREFTPTDLPPAPSEQKLASSPLQIVNGRFVIGNKTLWGGMVNDAWWLGQTSPNNALDAGLSITRFVPGRTGPGLTEDLSALASRVAAQGTPFYQSGPAIWYDRRRDDHSIVERPNSNVWAAFYELPWARSGQGKAWDGLSKYDVSTYNPWYFDRTREFARLSDQKGLVLYHHLYNNHNLLETASHWIDFPWRPANNINETNLPDPLEPKARVHVANQFYDATNPKLRELHRAYIFHVLDLLGHFDNILFGLSFQYSGPFAFQRFFQETVAEWEQKNNRTVRLVLDTSKNVTDAVLADPALAKQVAVIDMRYWHYLPDGTLWAPEGGKNLAFREMHPKEFGDNTTPQQVYRQVREYHTKYPDKAIVAWHSGAGPVPALMAGGAQVIMRNPTAGHGQGRTVDAHPLDSFVQQHLAAHLMHLQPQDGLLAHSTQNWALTDLKRNTVLLSSLAGQEITFDQKLPKKTYTGRWFDPNSGKTQPAELPAKLKKGTALPKPTAAHWLLLLKAAR